MFNRRMTERLTNNLADATSAHLEIVGGALRSHTTRHSVIKYEYFFHEYDFNYVIIYHGINDLWMNHVPAADFRDDYSHGGPWYKRNALLNHSLIARYIYNKMLWEPPSTIKKGGIAETMVYAMLGKATSITKNGANFRSLKEFETNLIKLINMIRNDNGVPILMTFAWHIPPNYTKQRFDQNALGYNNPSSYDKWPVELWGDLDYVREGLRRHNMIIRAIAKKFNIPLIDQETNLSKDISNFGDVVHLSEVGTDRFISAITDFFLSHKFLPKR